MLGTVLLVFLVLILLGGVGSAPVYPYSRPWGWGPSGLFGVLFIVLAVLWLLQRTPNSVIVP